VDLDLFRVAARVPFPAAVLVGPDEFLLLRVDRDHRVARAQVGLGLVVEVAELGVAVLVLAALGGLDVGLQAVTSFPQQSADHEITDLVPLLAQRRGQRPDRLAGPAQRRHRIPTGHRVDQRLERRHQLLVVRLGTFATTAGLAGAPGAVPSLASARPRRTVSAATPVAAATTPTPPRPSSAASAPSHNRRWNSDR